MRKKKWMRSGIALALTFSMMTGVTLSTPAVAEAGIGNVIGAIVGGAVAASEMSKQIKYYNTTEEGRQELFRQLQEKYGVYEHPPSSQNINTIWDRFPPSHSTSP